MKITELIPHDKALHLIGGTIIFAAINIILGPIIGVLASIIAAFGKEVYDYFHKENHTPDIKDAIFTILGGILGFICWIPS